MVYLLKTLLIPIFLLFLASYVHNWYFFSDDDDEDYWDDFDPVNETINQTIEIKEEFISNHLPVDCCHFKPAQIFNPYINIIRNSFNSDNKPLPACVKCLLCLAVADEIETLMFDFVDEAEENESHPMQEKECLNGLLQNLCKNGFKNHDLRKQDGLTIINRITEDTTHIPTYLDGKWKNLLREKCSFYLNNFDSFQIYNSMKLNKLNMTDYLCRSEGIFRECTNIPVELTDVEEDCEIIQKCCVKCDI